MQLENSLKVVMANVMAFYLKSHAFHWNVEGSNFYQYHKFFGALYLEVWESIDDIAQHIRSLDMYAPGSFKRFMELSEITEQTMIPKASGMIQELLHDNNMVIASLEAVNDLATDHVGLQNFIQGRIEAHEKHGWQLRALAKTSRN